MGPAGGCRVSCRVSVFAEGQVVCSYLKARGPGTAYGSPGNAGGYAHFFPSCVSRIKENHIIVVSCKQITNFVRPDGRMGLTSVEHRLLKG